MPAGDCRGLNVGCHKRVIGARVQGGKTPLLYIDRIEGRSPSEVRELLDTIHETVLDAVGAPERDRYHVVGARPSHEIVALDAGLGITRSSGPVVIRMVSRRRPYELRLRFSKPPASDLAERYGLDPADPVVSVAENDDENWSFGCGRAQLLTGKLTRVPPCH